MSQPRNRWITGSVIAACAVVFIYFFPLFHVVPLGQSDAIEKSESSASGETFEPVAFVDQFWKERLIPGSGGAVDAATLVAAIKQDPKSAEQTHGHRAGLGSVYYYFVSGTGYVVSVKNNSIGLSLEEDQTQVQILLESGPIFGNSVRDGTGLLDVNNFANSQDFNSVSSEINLRIESEVLPKLRENAKVGMKIRFVGCAEITDEDTDLNPLRIVPFIVETP